MINKSEGRDNSDTSFSSSYTIPLVQFQGDFLTGQPTHEQIVSSLADLAEKTQHLVGKHLRESIRRRHEQLGVEILEPDSADKRSADWFSETGKPFVTGVAVTCLAAAVTHPDVGMAAAHYNILNRPVIEHAFSVLVSETPESGNVYSPTTAISDGRTLSKLATNDHLASLAKKTVGEAAELFRSLEPSGDIPAGTEVSLIGLDFISPSGEQVVIGAAMDILREVALTLPRNDRENIEVTFQVYLGREGGIIYGGKGHPIFSKPQPYRFNEE